jgi:hypothetical protein
LAQAVIVCRAPVMLENERFKSADKRRLFLWKMKQAFKAHPA